MTTEDDFRQMIEGNPLDFDTLLVFADWLQDRDDVRAEAWRALGVQQKCPYTVPPTATHGESFVWFNNGYYATFGGKSNFTSELPRDWYAAIPSQFQNLTRFGDQRSAYDAAVAALLRLSAERRAELCERKAVLA